MLYLWILLFASLAIGAKAQGFDLSDALGDDDKAPTKAPIPKVPVDPKKPGGGGLDLSDALHPDPKDPAQPPPKPPAGDGFDLNDALGPDPVAPKKPAVNPPKGGGTDGGTFGDSDLHDVLGGGGYTPDKGKGGGHINNPSSNDGGKGYEDDHQEARNINMTSILSAVGVAVVGAVSSYFAYKKKRLCFGQGGNQMGGGLDKGESGGRYGPAGNRSGARGAGGGGGAAGVLSNLLRMV